MTEECEAEVRAPVRTKRWRQVFFRFALLYFSLSQWCWIDELMVNLSRLVKPLFQTIFGTLARAAGHRIFHLTGPLPLVNLMDTQLLYLELLCIFVISLVSATIWTLADPEEYRAELFYRYLRVWLRYTFAFMVLIYGVSKVFLLQFPFPSFSRLVQPLGDSAPLTLMSNFMGFSPAYPFVGGLTEVIGGVMLLWRRTALAGAVLLTIVMANIALMDFNYDFPVKMLSLHFFLTCVFLVAHDARRLWNTFARHRPVAAAAFHSEMLPWPAARVQRIAKVLVVLYVIVPVTIRTYRDFRRTGLVAPAPPLSGLYTVDSYIMNGVEHPPLTTDGKRWRYLAIEPGPLWRAVTMDNRILSYTPDYDAGTHVAVLSGAEGAAPEGRLTVDETAGQLAMQGKLGLDTLHLTLSRVDTSRMMLVGRGFHWISDAMVNQ